MKVSHVLLLATALRWISLCWSVCRLPSLYGNHADAQDADFKCECFGRGSVCACAFKEFKSTLHHPRRSFASKHPLPHASLELSPVPLPRRLLLKLQFPRPCSNRILVPRPQSGRSESPCRHRRGREICRPSGHGYKVMAFRGMRRGVSSSFDSSEPGRGLHQWVNKNLARWGSSPSPRPTRPACRLKMQSLNLDWALRRLSTEFCRWLVSSSSCFFKFESWGDDRVARSTVRAESDGSRARAKEKMLTFLCAFLFPS